MNVYPAIDLLGGRVVRLREGRRDAATVYPQSAGEVARRFAGEGAARLHVVDLDGAFSARRESRDAIDEILAAGIPVQLGGGVRDLDTCLRLAAVGVERIVLGTAMVRSPALVAEACRLLPGRIVVAVDARDGRVAIAGWLEATTLDVATLARAAAAAGAAAVLYTDIARDGLLGGANVEATARLAAQLAPVEVVASGGVSSLDDLRRLARAGVPAAVVGRALHDGVFTVVEALRAAREAG